LLACLHLATQSTGEQTSCALSVSALAKTSSLLDELASSSSWWQVELSPSEKETYALDRQGQAVLTRAAAAAAKTPLTLTTMHAE
jgi:hypothetical protein